MKTTFTLSIIRTFILAFLVIFSAFNLTGQTTHNVSVVNNAFNPSNITVNTGDKVIWTNTEGNHNVNGTQATFPTNPESFGNSVGSSWTYEYTFNTAGTYNYQCDPHVGFGMVGIVTVNLATNADKELAEGTNARLYPNPASQYVDLLFSSPSGKSVSIKVYSIIGKLIDQKVLGSVESYRLDLTAYKNGVYLMEINDSSKTNVLKFSKH
jgi:plastocyanin